MKSLCGSGGLRAWPRGTAGCYGRGRRSKIGASEPREGSFEGGQFGIRSIGSIEHIAGWEGGRGRNLVETGGRGEHTGAGPSEAVHETGEGMLGRLSDDDAGCSTLQQNKDCVLCAVSFDSDG